MRKIFLLLSLLILFVRPAHATITKEIYACGTSSTSSCTITFSPATSTGDTIFVDYGYWSASGQSVSTVDSASQTYTSIAALSVVSASGVTGNLAFDKQNSVSGVTTLTCNKGSADITCIVYVIHGVTTSSRDKASGNSNVGSSTSPASPASGTLASSSEIVIGIIGGSNGANYTTNLISAVSGGWTLDKYAGITGAGGQFNQATASQIVSATTTVTATFTSSPAMVYWNALVSYQASGGGASGHCSSCDIS